VNRDPIRGKWLHCAPEVFVPSSFVLGGSLKVLPPVEIELPNWSEL
jgi:hypothetical protein